MNRRKRKAAVLGALNVDIAARTDRALFPGDSCPGRVTLSFGGVGWNMARDLALLGAETVFCARLGRDGHEAAIRAEAARCGVSLAGCTWTEAENNRYVYIAGADGEPAAAVSDMRLCESQDGAWVSSLGPVLEDADVLAADCNLPEAALSALAAGAEAPIVADGVSTAKCLRLRGILGAIHTIKVNRTEAEALTGLADPEAALSALLEAGVCRAVISLGARGILCGEGDRRVFEPAPDITPVDTTGAGDALTAVFAAGLAEGLSLEECARRGVQAASLTAQVLGTVSPALSKRERESPLRKGWDESRQKLP